MRYRLWMGLFLLVSRIVHGADWLPLWDGRTLNGWKETEFAGTGGVEIKDGQLTLRMGTLTGIHRPEPVAREDYEIELEASRILGGDFFCGLTFPIGEDFATWIVGGWGGSVIGLSSLDGQDASSNETTKYRRFESNRWYKLRLRVERGVISTWIDEESVFTVDSKGKKVSLRAGEIELSKPFGIASWSTEAGLRNMRWRSLQEAPVAAAGEAQPVSPAVAAGVARIIREATNSLHGYVRLGELCDRFGPRLSGTTNLELAIDWILGEMKKDGLEAVRGERVEVPRWVRGHEQAELLKPRNEFLPMLGLGGSIATPVGGIQAPVLVVRSIEDLKAKSSSARGKIVVFDIPYTDYGETVAIRVNGAIEASRHGAVASVIRSVSPFSLRTPHTGVMRYDEAIPRIPHAALASEDTARMLRWQERGVPIELRLTLSAKQEPDAVSRNVVAELRGREFPDEILVVGGHIDSWDVGQGAQDDGGGCIAAWEAVRLMHALGLRPRRTVRVVLWTNEENGSRGAKAYRETHKAELGRHVVAMESDNGTFRPTGIGFTGSGPALNRIRGIAEEINRHLPAGVVTRGGSDADTGPLLEEGVPVLGMRVDRGRYFWYHHTEADTVDKVEPSDLQACTAWMAAVIYAIAEEESRLPR